MLKNMKTKWIVAQIAFVLFTGLALNSSAQKETLREKKEQIKAERKDFITRWCGFSETEGTRFWQLHDEMDEKLSALRKDSRKAMHEIKDKGIDNMPEGDLKKAMEDHHNSEQKQLDIRWEYHQKFIEAVGVKKTARFYEGERMFRKTLLERVRGHRMEDHHDDDGR